MKPLFRRTLLAVLLFASLPAAHAAIQTYNFNGALESGVFVGQTYSGSFSFDDAGLTSMGSEWLAVGSLSMNLLGTSYSLADGAAPAEVAYYDGNFVGLSFSNATGDPLFSLVAGSSALSEAFIAYDSPQGFSGTGSVTFTTAVPEPDTYAMMLAGIGLLGFMARRRRRGA